MSRGGVGSRRARIEAPLATASSRRVVIKVRVVHVKTPEQKHRSKRHFSYIEREGVDRDGGLGVAYNAAGATGRGDFEQDIAEEEHQFRMIISPEDGNELDLETYVRTYMQRVERDLGQKLTWLAVNHFNTDNPHSHVVIRGVDIEGREVWLDRAYVSHGLRERAQELATQELGPVPALEQRRRLQREAELHRYTGLDAAIERRLVEGVFRERPRDAVGRHRDPHRDGALRRRLEVLEELGLAVWKGRDEWELKASFGEELRRLQRNAEALRRIQSVVPADPSRCVVIARDEPITSVRSSLERGVMGVVRWKGLDEAGAFCAVVETVGGTLYHLPIASRAVDSARVGQPLDLKKAVDKDAVIEAAAKPNGWRYDLSTVDEDWRAVHRNRLEQLERLQLAKREGGDIWHLSEDFRQRAKATERPQAFWQMLSLRTDAQHLKDQERYRGYVWLDRVQGDGLSAIGFGTEVRNRLRVRHDHLRALGLDPTSKDLRWKLRELQRVDLEREIATARGGLAVPAEPGFRGVVHVHQRENGQHFVEIRAEGQFVVQPASRESMRLEGKQVGLEIHGKGKLAVVAIEKVDREEAEQRDQAQRQIAAIMSAEPNRVRVIGAGRLSAEQRLELEGGLPAVLRGSAMDARGRHHAILEAATGNVYHVPISREQSATLQAGQLVQLQPALGKDGRIDQIARKADGVFDLHVLPPPFREAFRRRLAELEGMQLATAIDDQRWKLAEGFQSRAMSHDARPVSLQAIHQPLDSQRRYPGHVWLDQVRLDGPATGEGGFGKDLREALQARREHLGRLGLDPKSEGLRWQLRDVQEAHLARALAKEGAGVAVSPHSGFEGIARAHRGANGERFVEIRGAGQFVVARAPKDLGTFDGKPVRIERVERGTLVLSRRDLEQEPSR